MTNNKENIIGCFVSGQTLMYDASEKQKEMSKKYAELFSKFIWGVNGIDRHLKKLNHKNYGNDLLLILFQFYLNPLPIELENLKEIENYRKKEKSIGIPVIIYCEDFFNKSDAEKYMFLKQSILKKMDLLHDVINKKKLDTNIKLLKADMESILV